MYEELPEIGKNLITNPEEKWAKNMKQNFTEKKKKNLVALQQMKR